MDFTKETCPVCNTQFTDSDDIVVCPVCGTPHHRECYEKNGSCINETRHADGYEWQSAENSFGTGIGFNRIPTVKNADPSVAVCPFCGAKNPSEEPVCLNCGARLYKGDAPQPNAAAQPYNAAPFPTAPGVVAISPDDTIGGHTVADTAEYIQSNTALYIPKLYKIEKSGSKLSFNWAAFLFSPYWFFYRKMAKIGVLLMIALLMVSVFTATPRVMAVFEDYTRAAEEIYSDDNASSDDLTEAAEAALDKLMKMPEIYINMGFQVLLHLFCGFYANALYKKKIEKDLDAIKQLSPSPEEKRRLMFARGGVSAMLVAASLIGYMIADNILTALLSVMQ